MVLNNALTQQCANRRVVTPLLMVVLAGLLAVLLVPAGSAEALQDGTRRGERTDDASTMPVSAGPEPSGTDTGEGELASCDNRVIVTDPDIGGGVLDATDARVRTATAIAGNSHDDGAAPPAPASERDTRGTRRVPSLSNNVLLDQSSSLNGGLSASVSDGVFIASNPTAELPDALWFDPALSYRYDYVTVTDAWALIPAVEMDTSHEVTPGETTPMTVASGSATGEASAVRTHSRLWAEIVLTPVGPRVGGGEWINVEISAACSRVWSEQVLVEGSPLDALADVTVPSSDPDRVEDTSPQHRGSFQFARNADGTIIEIVHDEQVAGDVLMFREGFVNSLVVDLGAAGEEATITETDRAAQQQSSYLKDRDLSGPVVSRTATVTELGLERRADIGLDDDGVVRTVQSRDEMTLTSTALPTWGESEPHDDRDIPWADASWQPAPETGAASPVDSHVVSVANLGLVTTQPVGPNVISDALSAVAAPALRNTLHPAVAQAQVQQIAWEKAQARFDQALEMLAATPPTDDARDAVRPEIIRLMTLAVMADADVADQAASYAISGSSPYAGQVAAAALGSAAAVEPHAAVALTQIVDSAAPEAVRRGAMLNALGIPEPDADIVTAVLAASNGDTDLAEMATMVAGSLAGRTPDSTARSLVSAELQGRAASSEAAAAGLDNLRRAELEPAPLAPTRLPGVEAKPAAAGPTSSLRGDEAKTLEARPSTQLTGTSKTFVAAALQACVDDLASPECWMDINCGVPELPEGPECIAAAESMCSFNADNAAWDDFCTADTGSGSGPGTAEPDPDPQPDPTDCADAICFWDVCEQVSFETCGEDFAEHCLNLAWADWTPTPPEGWGSCPWPATNPADDIGGTGPVCSSNCSAQAPPEPGDLMWDLVIGPNWAQGHMWTGIRPGGGQGARLANVSVEAGVELRSNGSVKPLIFGKAAYVMDMTDSYSEDNLDLAGMTVGQIERRLEVRADWLGDTFYSKTMDFPCGVGASDQLFPGVNLTESTSWQEEESPLSATKGSLLDNLVWSGPAVNGSVPVLGVVSISLGVGASARINGEWSWSLDMCDALTSDVLGTAAAQVKITGSVDVQAYAGVEFILVEAGVGIRATIFRVDAPLKASVQLVNDEGTLRLRPCFSFTITPTAWDVHAHAYATVFINLVFKKVVLWHKEVTLFSFNLGESSGLGGADGTWEVFASECDPVTPSPPILAADDGEPPYQLNGFFRNPLMKGPHGSLPIGLPGSDGSWNTPVIGTEYRTPVQKVLDAFCAVMGLDDSVQAPTIVNFETSTDVDAMYFTDTYEVVSGVGVGSWVTETSGSRVEEMQCGPPIANDTGDITITAEIERYLGWAGADDNTSELRLEQGEDYRVRFTVTNNSDQDHLITSVVMDGQPIVGCADRVLGANSSEVCESTFIALPDTDAEPFDDLAITSHYVAVALDGEPTEHHAWHHGIDWSSTSPSVTPYLQIFGTSCGVCGTAASPGPSLGTGGLLFTTLSIESEYDIVSMTVSAPFDGLSDCSVYADGTSAKCQGLIDYTVTEGYGPYRLDFAVTVTLPDGTQQVIPSSVWWYAHYLHSPELSVSTTIGSQTANTYPGPDLGDADTKDVLFTISNSNPYGEILDMTATWTADGTTSTSAQCQENSTTWTCEDPVVDLPNTGQIEEGVVTIRAVWGPEPDQFTEEVVSFWFQPGVVQPVFCDGNAGQGLTCAISNLAELIVLDEDYEVETAWTTSGSIVGVWDNEVYTGVLVKVADRAAFDAGWPGASADEATMLAVLHEFEELSVVDLIMINGFRVSPLDQVEAVVRAIAANYDVTDSSMGSQFAPGATGNILLLEFGDYGMTPVFPGVMYDATSGSRAKLNPIEDISLAVALPSGASSADIASPSQSEVLNYWDLVQWVNVALMQFAQHDAMIKLIEDEVFTPVGSTPFVVTNEFLTAQMWTPGEIEPNPIRRNLLIGAIDGSSISDLLDMATGTPTAQSRAALRARCVGLGGCSGGPGVEFTPTDISAIGWQTSGAEFVRPINAAPPEDPSAAVDPADFAAEELAWYRACDWLCGDIFRVGQIDVLSDDFSFVSTWQASGADLSDRTFGTLIVRAQPGQSASAAVLAFDAVSTSSDALAVLHGLVDSGVVEVAAVNNRVVGYSMAEITPLVEHMVSDHSHVGAFEGSPVQPGIIEVLPATTDSPLASIAWQVCTSIDPYVFATRISDEPDVHLRMYFSTAATLWDAMNYSTIWNWDRLGLHRQQTFGDLVLTVNHELVHVRQASEMRALVRDHPEAEALLQVEPEAKLGLASDAAMYNNCDDDGSHAYEGIPNFSRALEAAAIRFQQDLIDTAAVPGYSSTSTYLVAAHCVTLDCQNVYVALPFPMYGVVYGPTFDGSAATTVGTPFTEVELLNALDPTN